MSAFEEWTKAVEERITKAADENHIMAECRQAIEEMENLSYEIQQFISSYQFTMTQTEMEIYSSKCKEKFAFLKQLAKDYGRDLPRDNEDELRDWLDGGEMNFNLAIKFLEETPSIMARDT